MASVELSIDDLNFYKQWIDPDIIDSWAICAEYLIQKNSLDELTIDHKRLEDQQNERKIGSRTCYTEKR